MTKLMEWLAALAAFLAFYSYLYLHVTTGETNLSEGLQLHIILLPIHLIILFGLYSVSTVLYRVFTFNDCPEAAKEIQQQIEEAKADLSAKGLKF